MRRSLAALLASPGIAMIALAPALGAQVFLREAEAQQVLFPQSTSSVRMDLELSADELANLGRALNRRIDLGRYPYLEVHTGAVVVGYVFILDVVGESLPITFAVGVTADGLLQDVQVMVYREPRGGEIAEKRFRGQFAGKRLEDPIVLGKDVDAISGATISSRSATFAVRKGLALAALLRARAGTPGKP